MLLLGRLVMLRMFTVGVAIEDGWDAQYGGGGYTNVLGRSERGQAERL